MPKILFTLALIFTISISLYSQPLTWQKYFHLLNSDDEGWAICAADESNIFVGGLTSNSPMGCLLKLNQYGDTLWKKTYPDMYYITSMVSTNDGGCIFCANYMIRRIDSNGNLLWSTFTMSVSSIYLTEDNFLLVPGFALISKYDLNGNLIWARDIRGYANFYTAIQAYNGKYIFAGSVNNKAYIIETDTSSNIINSKKFYFSNHSFISEINKKNNNYIIAGTKTGATDSSTKFILKLNKSLDSINYKEVFSTNNYYRTSVLENGNSLFLFYNYFSNITHKDCFVIAKYDTNFNFIKKSLFEPLVHYVYCNDAIFFPGSENTRFAISGITAINGISNEDIYVASIDTSLTPLIGIEPISSSISETFRLYQNFPNPFNPVTKIKFSIPQNAGFKNELTVLKIYDIMGKEIAIPVNEILSPGEYEIEWDASKFSSGVYFCSLIYGNFTESRKMLLVK